MTVATVTMTLLSNVSGSTINYPIKHVILYTLEPSQLQLQLEYTLQPANAFPALE